MQLWQLHHDPKSGLTIFCAVLEELGLVYPPCEAKKQILGSLSKRQAPIMHKEQAAGRLDSSSSAIPSGAHRLIYHCCHQTSTGSCQITDPNSDILCTNCPDTPAAHWKCNLPHFPTDITIVLIVLIILASDIPTASNQYNNLAQPHSKYTSLTEHPSRVGAIDWNFGKDPTDIH